LVLKNFTSQLAIEFKVYDTQHFFSTRYKLGKFFEGKKSFFDGTFLSCHAKKTSGADVRK
jgi:deoxyribodipyrimidine photolyase-related protein